jgi:hypothetical protein
MRSRATALYVLGVIVSFLFANVIPAAAVPNAPLKISNNLGYAIYAWNSPVNATTTFMNMEDFTIETGLGEPAHVCRPTPHTGSHSGWLAVNVPAGTLTVNTAGSNYDTIVSVYSGGPNFSQLTSIGCNDDTGVNTSLVTVPLATGGQYYIQVSHYSQTPVAGPLTLQLSVTLTGGTPPVNDNFASALNITPAMYTKLTIPGTEYATIEAAEPKSSCISTNDLSHSVWFKYVVPAQTVLALSVRGTGQQDITGLVNNTMIAVYTGASLGALNERACDAYGLGYTQVPVIESVNANAGETYYIQVARRVGGTSPIGPSSYTLVIQHLLTEDNLVDQSFDAGSTLWKVKNSTNDGVFCPHPSTCDFIFTGGPSEASKLKQTFKLPAGFKTNVGDTVRIVFGVETASPEVINLTAKLKIVYSDGKPATMVSLKPKYFGAIEYPSYYVLQASTASKKIAGISIQFIHKSLSGSIKIFQVIDSYESVSVAGRSRGSTQDLLPVPAPAN